MREQSMMVRIYADTVRFVSGMVSAGTGVRRFTSSARQEFDALKRTVGSVQGQLASLGVTVGVVASIMQSARMDKGLVQIGQTAGMSRAEVKQLREELFRMSGETGQALDELQTGFNTAVQSGLSFREALPVIEATNKAVAVTGASADDLAAGLTVAATAFNFDLAKPGLALQLLDKMTVAGRQGNAELQNLSNIFARVGVNAASSGMGFEQTLGLIETLSLVEREPRRLATLADSTFRIFSDLNNMKNVAKATGIRFFDQETGARRDPVEILKDIRAQYGKLNTDKARALYINKAFGETDAQTIKGLRTLLSGDMLGNVDKISTAIGNAAGTLDKDLQAAIGNSVDQVGRLKTVMRNAADEFAQPINDTLSNVIKWGLDKKTAGGMDLSGKEILGGGAALVIGTLLAARYGGKAITGLLGKVGGLAGGVAAGKALEAAAGVTPVFVVNWPTAMGGAADIAGTVAGGVILDRYGKPIIKGAAKAASAIKAMGPLALTTAAGGVAAAGAVGYGAGTLLNKYAIEGTAFGDKIGGAIAKTLAFFGNEEARRAVEMTEKLKAAHVGGEISIKVNQDARVTSVRATTDNPRVPFNVDAGPMMAW